ncbi:DUF2142 domain-containing protein [Acetobacter oeni]|uniref:DUF2142 domain-containing protein n=1 Tax=Acetobacter oeni TaxID=304077 RepID=A0A511XLW7_9PROT|nr:DUF2142 domain-containing protein [Acetobacter oeni]MBB3882936.1 putative membrane protein [Acetobacter oeni]NHO19018.1 DUF2142 domain-containing protein [Acetobacter oeni]GBR04806.1 hypothetical protein AA21952_1534 [Acetobacter oeni LMG 21952]GEN63942.1 hypothetical protein AOE01nite_21660 [Acetobacter oeni]
MKQTLSVLSEGATQTARPRTLALLYFCCALIAISLLTLIVPPFENSDEFNHFSREDQILSGTLIARRTGSPPQSGGVVDLGINRLDAIYGVIRGHPEMKVTPDMAARGAAIRMGERGFQPFSNTTIYSPLLYIPGAAGLAAARLMHVNVARALELSRFTNGLTCIVLASLAIALAGGGAAFLTVVLSLPMTLSLFASVSQDGLIICAAALATCGLLRALNTAGSSLRAGWQTPAALFAALTLMSLGRPAYAPLLLAPLLLATTATRRRLMWFCAASVGLIGLWSVIVRAFVLVPLWAASSPGRQLSNLLHHPLLLPRLVIAAFSDHQGMEGLPFRDEMTGVLGWLDTPLPGWFYDFALVALAGTLIIAAQPRGATPVTPFRRVGNAILPAGAVALIFLLEYLTFTPVGEAFIVGVQGRYFLPLLPFLLLPLWRQQYVPPQTVRTAITCLVPFWLVIASVTCLHTVLVRYYVT